MASFASQYVRGSHFFMGRRKKALAHGLLPPRTLGKVGLLEPGAEEVEPQSRPVGESPGTIHRKEGGEG
jgi:hypothetical protein